MKGGYRHALGLLALVTGLGAGCQAPVQRRPPREPAAMPDSLPPSVAAPAPPPPPAQQPPTLPVGPTPVRVGLLAPFSGRYAAYGQAYLAGAQAALKGMQPALVQLVFADSKGEAIGSLEAVRRLIEEEQVVCIMGDLLNLTTLLAAVEANARGVPLLSNVASEDDIGRVGPWVFHDVPSRRAEADAAADLAMFGLRHYEAAVLSSDNLAARELATRFAERFVEYGGSIVASEVYPEGTTDFTVYLRRLRAAGPALLYAPVSADDIQLIAPALAFQGVFARLLGSSSWNTTRLLESVGQELEGALIPETGAGAPLAGSERGESNRFTAAGYAAVQRLAGLVATVPGAANDRSLMRSALEAAMQRGERAQVGFVVVRDGATVVFETP